MNILMLYPKYPPTLWNSDPSAKLFYHQSGGMPPLGLMTVASYLPEDFQVRLVDRNVREESAEDWHWADVVFLSLMAIQSEDYRVCIRNARQYGKAVAVGGPYTHFRAEAILADAQWVCVGEGEPIMAEFIDDLRGGRTQKVYQGADHTDMTSVQIPRYDLISRLRDYFLMPVQFSRGCPYHCEFCDVVERHGHLHRAKTPHQAIQDLTRLYELGFRGTVMIADDNFIGKRKHAKAILEEIASWNRANGTPFSFLLEASVDLGDDEELLEAMRQANVLYVFLGIETPDPEVLERAGKIQNTTGDALVRIGRIRSHGIHVLAGMVIGFDCEPREIFEAQRRFIRESGIGVASLALLVAVPYTRLWRRLKSEGRLLDAGQGGGEPSVDGLNFIPKGNMTRREYIENYVQLIQEIYSPERFFERSTNAVLQTRMRCSLRPNLRTLKWVIPSTLRKIWHLGIRAKEGRLDYLKGLCKVLVRNPSAIEAFGFDSYFFYHLHKHAAYTANRLEEYLADPGNSGVLDRKWSASTQA